MGESLVKDVIVKTEDNISGSEKEVSGLRLFQD
jgi:hypothetical protein